MTISSSELLSQLEGRGVHLYLADGQLRAVAGKGALTAELGRLIRDRRDELIELLRGRQDERAAGREAPIPVADRGGPLPLSFAQQRLWFLSQMEPDSVEYNTPIRIYLREAPDIAALTAALAALVQRHEVLRTRLAADADGEPRQLIDPPAAFDLPLVDLSAEPDPASAAEEWAAADGLLPFDLAAGAPFRATLLRVNQREHVLAVAKHHAVSDEWSDRVLRDELGRLYEAFSAGRPAPLDELPALPVQYADFAAWQRARLTGEVLAGQLTYWRDRLAGAPVLDLPTDRPRPPVRSTAGAVVEFRVPPAAAEGLRAIARRANASMFMTLLAAYDVLLGRHAGQDDVVVGTPVANRTDVRLEGLVGNFINTLVLRTDLSGDPTFAELLDRVRTTTLAAFDHQDLPFERLVDELATERDRSRTPVFQALFNYYAREDEPDSDGDDAVGAEEVVFARTDVRLTLSDEAGRISGRLEYACDLFDRVRIERMAGHFVELVAAVAADPGVRLSGLPRMSAAECVEIESWSAVEVGVPRPGFVHELFAECVRRAPGAVAVRCGADVLTYGELEERAVRLSSYLRGVGVGAEQVVGLCFERGVDVVVAMLAVWKAGAAYLPLDPEYPLERLAFMLGDADVSVVVGGAEALSDLPAGRVRTVAVDDPFTSMMIAASPDVAPVGVVAGQAAYVIYTSGSTGRPKGVVVSHGGLRNLVWGQRRAFGVDVDVVLQFASFGFDASVSEVALALAWGGTLVVAGREERAEPQRLAALVRERGVSVATLPPSLLSVFGPGDLDGLGTLVVAGERLSPALAQMWAGRMRLINAYGPTEVTVCATAGRLAGDAGAPIGSPIGNVPVFVVDDNLERVPVGVVGQLLVGGVQVARGYLGQPALTAERFVADVFSGDGSRLYRTGDRVRWLVDGRLEFVGRVDDQVKVRGFRIEPGEIEQALCAHPDVSAAAVVADGPELDRRLVAYVVAGAASEGVPSTTQLRRFLGGLLPEYMIPGAFVEVSAIPLTANGKVDRAALAAVEVRAERAEEFVAPRTATEELLAEVWLEVLGVERIGVHDNFFELGGHSLLATRVVSRVRNALGAELPVSALFDSPTIAGLAALLDDGADGHTVPPIVPVGRDEPLPLSFAQQRLWFLAELEPDSVEYNTTLPMYLRGDLDVEALTAALAALVARHEVLRTRLVADADGVPQQIIDPPSPFALPVVDLTVHADPEDAAEQWLSGDRATPFDLARGPLIRAALLRLGAGEHVLALSMHHVVGDEWSTTILRRELDALYEARRTGRPDALEPLPVQYADYAVWQRRWLSDEALGAQQAFWRDRLAGAASLELPADRPRPAVRTSDGAVVHFQVPADVADGVRAVARSGGASMFMTLLGAFTVLLGRYSGQDDVVVGTPVANRNRAEIEGLIGFFVNTLVLRTELSGDPTFAELLGRVRSGTLAAYANQDLPFERLVDALGVERDRSRTPLFQVLFSYVADGAGTADEAGDGGAADGAVSPPQALPVKFDLAVGLNEAGGGLAGSVQYSTALFDADRIVRMIGHFVRLLSAVAADAGARLSSLPMLTEAEHADLAAWNDTAPAAPAAGGVHELIARRARQNPGAAAVQCGDARLSYGELDDRAGRLAHRLRAAGVRAESLVVLCAERGVDLVVAALAVWKAGGAYLPIDPDQPLDRLSYILADSRATVLVGHRRAADALSAAVDTAVWLDDPETYTGPALAAVPARPGQAAYAIYTSGSTGRPKGVAVTHDNLVAFLAAMGERPGLAAGDTMLAVTTLGFDIAGLELFLPLVNGARVVVAERETARVPRALAAELESTAATVLQATPATWRMLLDDGWAGASGLRALCGGEALTADLAGALAARTGELWNMYGPTETTIWSSCARLTAGDDVTLGAPIAGTALHVLDRSLSPVPVGVPGELFIAGAGVARGYHGRADLTAERFVADPFAAGGLRMYRTGDLVRRRPDGNLEFLGRSDHQLKIRGFRIEPAEIEAALLAHPRVGAAVVIADGDDTDRRLVAYTVPADGVPAAPGDLRTFLRGRLPDYMVPAVFVELTSLPLNTNGKVDRAALPAPERGRADVAEDYVAGRTPTEELLAGIWAQVLDVPRVGVHHNFFALGGHSLLATRVMSRIRAVFDVEVPVAALFDAPTVAGLAAVIEGAASGLTAPPIVPVDRRGPLPLSFAQQRLWFLAQFEPESAEYNTPMSIPLGGDLDVAALAAALCALVARHEVLRTRLVAGPDGVPYQAIDPAPERFELPVVDVSEEPDPAAAMRAWVAADGRVPFDLAAGPLFRATLVRVAADDHVLALAMHHVVGDEWSSRVLRDELAALYAGAELPALPVQYADFAVWQRRWLSGEVLEGQLGFWRERLDGLPVLELPTDRPRPPLHSSEGAALEFTVPADVASGLRAVAQAVGASMFMTMQSALAVLLGRYSGQEDVVVGAPIASRNRAEIEGLIGFFVNTLVLRTDLSGDPTFAELVGRVRERTLAAYAHQDLPFEQLVDALDVDRDRSRTPLFQVLFNYLPDGGEADPQELLVPRVVPAKFDLSVVLAPSGSGFVGSVKYSTVLFDAERMVRLVGHFVELLSAVAAAPDRRLSLVAVLAGAERRQLERWNDTAAVLPAVGGVHELIGERVAADPHAVAVRCGDVVLTYGELWRRSGVLAGFLAGSGVGPESVVGLCLGRGVEFVVAVLAVWRAGGAYLPLDPNYPVERLVFMVADGGASVVLGQRPVAAELASAGVAVTWLEDVPLDGADAMVLPAVVGDQAAYVIYTSGSTGVPKGVVVAHRGLLNLAVQLGPVFGVVPGRVALQFAAFGFDAAVMDVAVVLSGGGSLVIASGVQRSEPAQLAALIRAERVEVASVVPSLLSQLDPDEVAGVGTWVVGSERVGADLVGAWAGRSRMFNAYGPTEVSVLATTMPCGVGEVGDPPIGGPLGNVRVFVVDGLLRPVPVGVPGELLIGGVGLARGYAGRAELTAERFVADPFAGDGGRLYRSGDVVRWRADGVLEFVGRADAQVKVRGFRVELGEVEAVLREHPAVDDAVVVADG
ncbi:amino acid adenylation domain-containing protein, partial [Dactylosporangium darangshiense]|uniref:amino acid adenylation domain-containing protein n=1 Tax=Dactylosporangium darangshiense TaxID=579108 RepID=UPI0031F1A0A6